MCRYFRPVGQSRLPKIALICCRTQENTYYSIVITQQSTVNFDYENCYTKISLNYNGNWNNANKANRLNPPIEMMNF